MDKNNQDKWFEGLQVLKRGGRLDVFHLTHINNLESILRHGIWAKSRVESQISSYEDISDPEVQKWRADLHDFVPVFFIERTPMMYKKHKSGVTADLCLLVIDVYELIQRVEFLKFSNGNAASAATTIFSDPEMLISELPTDVLLANSWNSYVGGLKEGSRKRSAELLVKSKVPVEAIRNIRLRDRGRSEFVRDVISRCGVTSITWEVKPSSFFA